MSPNNCGVERDFHFALTLNSKMRHTFRPEYPVHPYIHTEYVPERVDVPYYFQFWTSGDMVLVGVPCVSRPSRTKHLVIPSTPFAVLHSQPRPSSCNVWKDEKEKVVASAK